MGKYIFIWLIGYSLTIGLIFNDIQKVKEEDQKITMIGILVAWPVILGNYINENFVIKSEEE